LTDALIAYALFLAQAVTIAALVGALLIMLVRSRRGTQTDEDSLDITDLNERYRETGRALRHATLSGKPLRKAVRADHKADKAHAKAGDEARKRLYVIDFHGDIKASEVAALRECITAVLLAATEGDSVLVRLDNAGGLVAEHGHDLRYVPQWSAWLNGDGCRWVEDHTGQVHRDAKAIVGELAKHDPSLVAKPRWLVLNKLDLIPEEDREKAIKDFLKAYKKATKYDGPVFPIAAINGEGTKPLIYAIQAALEELARPVEEPLESGTDELPET
jgi:hypothetical protein